MTLTGRHGQNTFGGRFNQLTNFPDMIGHTKLHGREAMRQLEDNPVDIVVTDIFMPRADGMEVISMLRRVSPSTRIIAMSGYDNADDIDFLQVAITFGATSILKKPFRAAELLKAVADCSPADS